MGAQVRKRFSLIDFAFKRNCHNDWNEHRKLKRNTL